MSLQDWKQFKEYYEREYKGSENEGYEPNPHEVKLAKELEEGGATIAVMDMAYNVDELDEWITDTQANASGFDEDLSEVFPNLDDYINWMDGISIYFLLERLDRLKKGIQKGDKELIKIVGQLKWKEFTHKIKDVKDIFLF